MVLRFKSTPALRRRARRRIVPSNLARRVKKLERKTSGIESLFIDFTNSTAIISDALSLRTPIEDIIQGDDSSERNGDSITITSLQCRFLLTAYTADDHNIVRILFVVDKQHNGADMTAAELFLDSTVDDILVSPLNLDNMHRFKILSDDLVEINNTGRASVVYKKYVKCNYKIRFDASTGVATDITNTKLHIVIVGNSTGTGDVQSICRVRYLDS